MSLSIDTQPSPVDRWQSPPTDDSAPSLSGACALLAVLLQAQSCTQSGAKTDIAIDAKKLEDLRQQLADAIQKAKEASEHSGFLGFLGDIFGNDIAQIVGAVAAIAATIATGGAAAPLLVMAISAGLQLAAKAAAELGLDPKLCLALSIASVAVGFCSGTGAGQAASSLSNVTHYVQVGAKIAEGGAAITGGVLHHAAAQYHADELNYQADAAGYHAKQTVTQLSIDDAFALLERALRGEQRETSTVSEIIQNNSDTNAALCSRI